MLALSDDPVVFINTWPNTVIIDKPLMNSHKGLLLHKMSYRENHEKT